MVQNSKDNQKDSSVDGVNKNNSNTSTKASTPSKSVSKPAPSNKIASNKISSWLKHFIAYSIAICIIGILGYLYYTTYLVNQRLIQTNTELSSSNSQQLTELQKKLDSELIELTLKYQELQHTSATEKEQLNQLAGAAEVSQQQILLLQQQIKPRELWQIQLNQLLFLAEQERQVGSKPASVSYLLQQIQKLLLTTTEPTQQIKTLNNLVKQDLSNYAALANINNGRIYQDINILESIITDDLKFKSSFYDEIADTQNTNLWKEYNLPSFLQKFANSIGQYIRISRDTEPNQILTQDKRDITLSSMVLMLNQAKNSLIQGDADLYHTILEDVKQDTLKFFADGLEKNRAVDSLDQLLSTDILPNELPPLQSYKFFFRP